MRKQHLHNRIGNAVGEAKARMFRRLKANLDLRSAIALFTNELQRELAEIVDEAENSELPAQLENLIS